MSSLRECACPYIEGKAQCPSDATQEDLLCDFCSGRASIGVGALACGAVSRMLGRGLSLVDHRANNSVKA